MRRVTQHSATEGYEDAACDERATLLTGDAEGVEAGDGEEAEHRSGPLGDGPVEVTGHGGAS